MSDLRSLYQEVILDHNRCPRNFCKLAAADRMAQGVNPLCGDRITLYLKLQENRITEISFQGAGCAISTASASLMTEHLKGKTFQEAQHFFQAFHALVTSSEPEGISVELGKLSVFAGVHEFPARVKCATLAWHTLKAALENVPECVTTE